MTSWQELSGAFSEKKCYKSLDPRVLSHLESLSPDKSILVACSGGADSVFLALALYSGLPRAKERLHLLHFNHGLRDRESDLDAAFVSNMASDLGIPCHVGRSPAFLPKDEASLREARYDWMIERFRELNAGALCLGHHADDVVESLLMAVLTGAGPAGLSSPMPVKQFSDGHVRLRPMLAFRRDEIIEILNSGGIPWREDASNQDTDYTRNWLRLECIPRLRERIPQDIYTGTRRTRELMQECVSGLDESALSLGLDISSREGLKVDSLIGQPAVLIRRVLMSWWLRNHASKDLQRGAIDAVVRLLRHGSHGTGVDIGKGQALFLDDQGILGLRMQVEPISALWRSGCHWCWAAGPLFTPAGAQLFAEKVPVMDEGDLSYKRADPSTTAWLNWEGQCLVVRQWQPGDRYQPLGAPGSRKLQDIFVDAKLSREQKRDLPVILDMEGSILWIPGFPPAEDFRLFPESNSGLKLTYISQ